MLKQLKLLIIASSLSSLSVMGAEQIITVSTQQVHLSGNQNSTVQVNYSTSDNEQTSGIGLAIYFDATAVNITLSDIITQDLISQSPAVADVTNDDNDATTDSKILVAWANLNDAWPSNVDTTLFNLRVNAKAGLTTSKITIKPTQTAIGYSGQSANVIVSN